MDSCKHRYLELLPERKKRLRCQHCHLIITADELSDGYCPECFESQGKKRYDFEKLEPIKTGKARYRCESCGAIIETE